MFTMYFLHFEGHADGLHHTLLLVPEEHYCREVLLLPEMLEVVERLVALQIENLGIALVACLQSDGLAIGIIGRRA